MRLLLPFYSASAVAHQWYLASCYTLENCSTWTGYRDELYVAKHSLAILASFERPLNCWSPLSCYDCTVSSDRACVLYLHNADHRYDCQKPFNQNSIDCLHVTSVYSAQTFSAFHWEFSTVSILDLLLSQSFPNMDHLNCTRLLLFTAIHRVF